MADESQTNSSTVLRAISWRDVLPFTHLFRAFRVAVHPSKLVLGLLALLTLYVGGRVLDAVWPQKHRANYGEAVAYEKFAREKTPGNFSDQVRDTRKANRDAYAGGLRDMEVAANQPAIDAAADSFDLTSEMRAKIMGKRAEFLDRAQKEYDKDKAEADKVTDVAQRERRQKELADRLAAAKRDADQRSFAGVERLKTVLPRGIFEEFFEYQVTQVNGVARGVFANNWLVGGGVVERVTNFFAVGPRWLWGQHPLYALLFSLLFLLTWAVFGGAIARIAAVHVARDEKISVRQALRFSINKVLSFVFAPLIPLIIVLGIGLLLAVGGLLFYVPWVGPIAAGGLFFLALIAGVVITLVLFGTVGGLNLMFPTIAVEGSDSFDAISRSFSYVFARPWRMLFYTAVAVAYGALSYLFVRFFVWVTLAVTHFFVSWFLGGQPGYYFNWIWPEPAAFGADKLPYEPFFTGLKFTEDASAFLISFWVYLLIGLVGAFAISFYFSANTIIYYLMRREVDATELEDVYVEDAEDDLVDVAAATGPGGSSPALATGGPATAPAATSPAGTPATIVSTTAVQAPVTPPVTPPSGGNPV